MGCRHARDPVQNAWLAEASLLRLFGVTQRPVPFPQISVSRCLASGRLTITVPCHGTRHGPHSETVHTQIASQGGSLWVAVAGGCGARAWRRAKWPGDKDAACRRLTCDLSATVGSTEEVRMVGAENATEIRIMAKYGRGLRQIAQACMFPHYGSAVPA